MQKISYFYFKRQGLIDRYRELRFYFKIADFVKFKDFFEKVVTF